MSVCWLVGWSVSSVGRPFIISLQDNEVTLPCTYLKSSETNKVFVTDFRPKSMSRKGFFNFSIAKVVGWKWISPNYNQPYVHIYLKGSEYKACAPIGAWKCYYPPFLETIHFGEIMTDKPTVRPTKRRTDWGIGKLNFQEQQSNLEIQCFSLIS